MSRDRERLICSGHESAFCKIAAGVVPHAAEVTAEDDNKRYLPADA